MQKGKRRGQGEIVGVLLMLAIVTSLGVMVFAISTGGMTSFNQEYATGMSAKATAESERFAVEQVAFNFPSLSLDGSSTNQAPGSSSSIAAALTTTSSNDIVMAYVSPAEAGSNAPPAVSAVSGGGLTWVHRTTTSTQTFPGNNYVPITLTNSQGSATPTIFQQKVTWNPSAYAAYESSDLGNIRFCADANCLSPLLAWIESCTPSCTTSATSASAWVRLTTSIGATGGTLTVYMVFQPTTTDFDGNRWGEAPQLSSTYGQFDNGASVFSFYDNFAGTTLSGKWTVLESAGNTVVVNNGVTFTNNAKNNYAVIASATQTQPLVAEVDTLSETAVLDTILGVSTSQSLNAYVAPYNGYSIDWNGGKAQDFLSYQLAAGGTTLSKPASASFPAGIWQMTWSAVGSELFVDGAGVSTALTDNHVSPIANYGIYFGLTSNTNSGSESDQWARMRAVPPSNVMPSVSLGSVGTATLTLDLEEWYAVSPSPLSAVSISASFTSSYNQAAWLALFGVSGANTASPFDPSAGLPAVASGVSNVQTTISTSVPYDTLLYACAAGAGGVASGLATVYSNTYPSFQNELVGYEVVSTIQTNLVESCGGTNTNGAEISDALAASPGGADLYIRDSGTVPTTIQDVYITDTTSDAFISETTVSSTVNVGGFAEVPHGTLAFYPAHGQSYSFVVTSSLGNSVVYNAEAS